ncbi:hypothetical protein G9A89_005735 [Geosiphon pyriformis]|nr:hypothetical protein G9A89_005735 [Geosiphon pyriformis]
MELEPLAEKPTSFIATKGRKLEGIIRKKTEVISSDIPPFVAMEPVGFAAGGSGSVSAGLEIWFGVKNKHSVGFHSRSMSYKKLKKPVAVDGLVESSAGVSNVMDESGDGPIIG